MLLWISAYRYSIEIFECTTYCQLLKRIPSARNSPVRHHYRSNTTYDYVWLQVACVTEGLQKVAKFFTVCLLPLCHPYCLCPTLVTRRHTVIISNQKVIRFQEKKTFQHQTKQAFSPFQVLLTTQATFSGARRKLTLISLALSWYNINKCLSDILFNEVLLYCIYNCLNAIWEHKSSTLTSHNLHGQFTVCDTRAFIL